MEKVAQEALAEKMVDQVSSIAVIAWLVNKLMTISIISAAREVMVDLDVLETVHPQEEMEGQLLLEEALKII